MGIITVNSENWRKLTIYEIVNWIEFKWKLNYLEGLNGVDLEESSVNTKSRRWKR